MGDFNPAIAAKIGNLSSTILSGHYIYNNAVSDEHIKRSLEKNVQFRHNITYEITEDPTLIAQYHMIREQAYIETYNDHNAGLDEFDNASHTIVAKNGSKVIGGLRATISTPENRRKLPIEKYFNLKEVYPNLDLKGISYAEATRQAVLSGFRKGEIADMLQYIAAQHALDLYKIEICFGCSTLTQIRRFSMMLQRMGYKLVTRPDHMIHIEGSDANLIPWAVDFTKGSVHYEKLISGHIQQHNSDYLYA